MRRANPAARAAPGPSIAEFESLDVDAERFDHEAHLYVAWLYLEDLELLEAIDRYRTVLRRLTIKLGVPDKYHETITWLYLAAVAERRQAGADWHGFKASNPELFAPDGAFISRYYSARTIASDTAKRQFVLPDRQQGSAFV